VDDDNQPFDDLSAIMAMVKFIMEDLPEGVTRKHDVMGGEPCIAGTRLPAAMIASLVVRHGVDVVRRCYPDLTSKQIGAALAYEAYFKEQP
jgi:uncharacterized protein (DUF433 family)